MNSSDMNQKKTITDHSVLAARYVPQQDRLWSSLPPTFTLACKPDHILLPPPPPPPSSSFSSSSISLLSSLSINEDPYTTTNNNIPLTWPNALQEFNSEFRFAIDYKNHEAWIREQTASSSTPTPTNPTSQPSPLFIPLFTKPNLPSVYKNISDEDNMHGYVQTFQALIQAERREVLLRYEEYTQYHQTIQVVHPFMDNTKPTVETNTSSLPSTNIQNNKNHLHKTSATNENTNKNQHTTTTVDASSKSHTAIVTAMIAGIADSKPAPQPGDFMILRPHCYLSIPIKNPNSDIVHWTPQCHIVDILCSITHVSRGFTTRHTDNNTTTSINYSNQNQNQHNYNHTSNNRQQQQQHQHQPVSASDSIKAKWLEPDDDRIIQASYGLDENRLFQLRIVPNKKEYERTMIALLWLNALLSSSPPISTSTTSMTQATTTATATAAAGTSTTSTNTHAILKMVIAPLLFPSHAPTLNILPLPPSQLRTTTKSMTTSLTTTNNAIEDLNPQQASFVRIVLARTNQPSYNEIRSPIILTGPAGTGKTKTLLCAILEILKQDQQQHHHHHHHHRNQQQHRILICTPSHTASNVITQRLAKAGLKSNELFRLVDTDRNPATIPISILSYCCQGPMGTFEIPSLHMLLQYKVIVSTCTDSHLLYRIGCTNQQLRSMRIKLASSIQKHCTDLNVQVSLDGIYEPHFTHFFMDEAAQATEPESLIPLSVVVDPIVVPVPEHQPQEQQHPHGATPITPGGIAIASSTSTSTNMITTIVPSRKVEIALVGDPRQLSPSVYSNDAAIGGLDHSWIERLLRRPINATKNNGSSSTNNNSDDDGRNSAEATKKNGKMDAMNPIHSNNHKNDDNSMLGPDLIEIDDWIRYSLEQDGHEQLSVFLRLNYRGHPSFLMVPSSLFYSDKLQRAGYTNSTNGNNNDNDGEYDIRSIDNNNNNTDGTNHHDETFFHTEQYWCQKLRIIETMAFPVTIEAKRQPINHPHNNNDNDKKSKPINGQTKKMDSLPNNNQNNNNKTNHFGHDNNEVYFTQYKQWNWPIHFRGVIGKDINTKIHNTFSIDSWCNDEEARVVLEAIQELTKSGSVGGAVPTNKIGVIAPFRGQVVLIRNLLRANNFGTIDVGTVEDYQSAERDVIILSLTRSSPAFLDHDENHRIGLFGTRQAKRCNVALTRAQNFLIVIGNPKLMVTDSLWRQFLWFCFRNVLWYGDSGGTLPIFSVPCTSRAEMKVVHSYDVLKSRKIGNNSTSNNTTSNDGVALRGNGTTDDDLTNIVVISTLERTLRQCI